MTEMKEMRVGTNMSRNEFVVEGVTKYGQKMFYLIPE